MRALEAKENACFRIGRKTIKLDFYIPKEKTGIVYIDWRRNVHTNKLLQLENIMNMIGLKKLILICNGISSNAKDFLERREIPINIVYSSEVIQNRYHFSSVFSGS